MRLSERLKQDHESGDFGKALDGYSEIAKCLEEEIAALRQIIEIYDNNKPLFYTAKMSIDFAKKAIQMTALVSIEKTNIFSEPLYMLPEGCTI